MHIDKNKNKKSSKNQSKYVCVKEEYKHHHPNESYELHINENSKLWNEIIKSPSHHFRWKMKLEVGNLSWPVMSEEAWRCVVQQVAN